jgi:hypothetical protein
MERQVPAEVPNDEDRDDTRNVAVLTIQPPDAAARPRMFYLNAKKMKCLLLTFLRSSKEANLTRKICERCVSLPQTLKNASFCQEDTEYFCHVCDDMHTEIQKAVWMQRLQCSL